MTRTTRAVLRAALLAALASSGCVSVVRHSDRDPIDPEAVASVQVGATTLAQALGLLGSPLACHRHPDGLLLEWRTHQYDYLRLGLEPDRVLSFIPAGRLSSIRLLSLVLHLGEDAEDKLVLLIDDRHVVAGLGYRRGTATMAGEPEAGP